MSPYGEGLDPVPYIAGAYGVAVLFIGGFTAWIIAGRKKLRQVQIALKERS